MDATCAIQASIHVFSLVRKYVSRILGTYHIILVDFFCKKIKNRYSYIAITNIVIVGMKIFFQEICFTNIHRIYQLSFFVEQAEFVV